MSSLTCGRLMSWAVAAVLLQIIGLSLFVLGFFPVKPALSGVSGPESYRSPLCNSVDDQDGRTLPPDKLRSLYEEMSGIPPSFDQLILMVVDGLPAEFVLGKGDQPPTKPLMEAMPYTQALLSNGMATGYHAKAAPPTVTMPRLKAMVSGAIGGFLDVAFNFNTQALLDDNIIGQFYNSGWKMVMHGDETWLKLFPGLFRRHDGVSSFYVKDTVEVDHNVSRHLEAELVADDWNLLILHYLGLDHVGHIGGRDSILMNPKLKEMDDVIKMIHMSKVLPRDKPRRQTLLVVVSDHGMTDNGNHGGSSYEETDSLALFIGLRSKVPNYAPATYNTAFQVDIAPTLALLFGVPIPKNNVGVLMAETFNSLTAYFLNPKYHYKHGLGSRVDLLEAVQVVLEKLKRDPKVQAECMNELLRFRDAKGSFGRPVAINTRENIQPDDQRLRALELNSWQLLRLLQAQLPDLSCGSIPCNGFSNEQASASSKCIGSVEQKFCCLFSKAVVLHSSWKSKKDQNMRSDGGDDFRGAVAAYDEFLRIASEWLSRRATDKPLNLLTSGVVTIFLSCLILLRLLFWLCKEFYFRQKQFLPELNNRSYKWHLDETFVLGAILILVLSMGSSSMVEEEQYTWHFLTSTLYLLFLRKTIQSLPAGPAPFSLNVFNRQNCSSYSQIFPIILVLICGRILRGWHQGGVNWTHLPDISKWLEQAGTRSIKSIQIASTLLVISLSLFVLYPLRSKRIFVPVVQASFSLSGLLVLLHNMQYQYYTIAASSYSATSIAQIIYASLSVTVVMAAFALPWIAPISICTTCSSIKPSTTSFLVDSQIESRVLGLRDCTYLIGWTYTTCWCLLQLLLQQPINAVPILLIILQILATMLYFSSYRLHQQWVEVAALYFLGMAGHFGLGNSNSLATIDVAGAFIGLSSHSTLLAGILMFIITYASSLLILLSMVMYISIKDTSYLLVSQDVDMGHFLQMIIGLPCLVPLGLNSVMLTAFTIILLLMRNHLFVWSVFSPKYLYVCGTTASVYAGVSVVAATGIYMCLVSVFRKRIFSSRGNRSSRNLGEKTPTIDSCVQRCTNH